LVFSQNPTDFPRFLFTLSCPQLCSSSIFIREMDAESTKQQFSSEQIHALRRNPPHILNERELAIYLDISERNARALRQRRAIPHVRLGGRILYRLAEVNKALEKLEIRAV
jgi:hypothetical protein